MDKLSASKIVFIMIALTACIGLFMAKITPDNFMILAGGAFAFYFTKGTPPADSTPDGAVK